MAIAQLTSRTQVSTLVETSLNGRVVLQPNTWYTCPAGKKAIVKGRVTCTGTGAAAEARFSIAGVIMFRFAVFGGNVAQVFPDGTANYTNTTPTVINSTPLNVFREFETTLAAGETIITSQDSGTNAEFNLFGSVKELPA